MSGYNKKTKLNKLPVVVALLLCILTIGYTLGFMLRKTDPVENTFSRGVVSCEVVEAFDESAGIKSSISVKNTGNVSAYLRVQLVSYWVDGSGNIVGKASKIPSLTLSDGWQQTSDTVYQYDAPVSPNEATPNLLAEGSSIKLEVDDEGNTQVLEVFAEAIQSDPASAKDNWEYFF